MSTLIPPAIETLFDQYFNQTITPEGLAQLEAWLAENPTNAETLARAGLAHGLTREVVKRKMESNLRPRYLHFAKPVLLAASVLLAVGVGIWVLEREAQVKKVVPVVAMGEVEMENRKLAEVEKTVAGLRGKMKVARNEHGIDLAGGTTKAYDDRLVDKDGDGVGDSAWFYPKTSKTGEAKYVTGVRIADLSEKSGTGTVTLSGANTYSGDTTVTAGVPMNSGRLSVASGSLTQNGLEGGGSGNVFANDRTVGFGGNIDYHATDELRKVRSGFRQDGSVYKGAPQKGEGTWETRSNIHGSFLVYTDKNLPSIAPSAGDPKVDDSWLASAPAPSRDQYAHIWDNKFASPLIQPLSTFSVDVDTAAYANARRFISEGSLPPPDAVRIEEMLNYFSYDYAPPAVLKPGDKIGEVAPFAAHTEVCACPWNASHKLVRIGLKGAEVDMSKRPPAHLTFLVDVSGSMETPDRLPLAKAALVRLLTQLRADDHVSLVVYAGNTGVVLEDAPCSEKAQILGAIDHLSAGGSTNGAGGIQQAYEMAQKHFVKGGVNRVILCTDGDFNVGTTDTGSLITLAKEKANPANGEGVYLSTCGFGRDNLNDHMMEQIADAGNGNYSYIDSLAEAEKVFVKQAGGTLVTIAKDVKLQLEFNPAKVGKYRLIGYENRVLKAEDFNDDTVDAGDIGAGHTVTALYEVEPVGANPYASIDDEIKDLERQAKAIAEFVEKNKLTPETAALQKQALDGLQARITQLKTPTADRSVDPLTYQNERKISEQAQVSGDLLTLKLRYKNPDAKAEQGTSKLLKFTLKDADTTFEKASADTRFAASVAAYGMILRGSEFKGTATLKWVEEAAGTTWQQEIEGKRSPADQERADQRAEFVNLVRKAQVLKKD